MTTTNPPKGRRAGKRPVLRHEIYDPTVSELFVGDRPWETLALNQHLHELWQVLGLDDEDEPEPALDAEES